MLSDFGFLGIFMVLAIIVPLSMLLIPWVLTLVGVKPHRPDKVKTDTYECGMETVGGSWVRFNFRYYFFAISFLIFDVEAVFLFPWAVRARELQWFGLGAVAVFVGIITLGLLYEWKKKALEWR
jgi:NADH-quinone oxidoreductase subunit A